MGGYMKTTGVEAVIFDMDGVILDSEGPATMAWKRAMADLGYRLTDELNQQLIGRNVPDSNAILRSTLGADFPAEAARQGATRLFAELTAAQGIPVKSGLAGLLDFLDAKELKRAVATSTAREDCERALTRCKLLERFKVIVCGDEVAVGKPAPDIFLRAAKLLEAAPEACVVLEDSFAGIRAAHAARMIPIMVPDRLQPDDTIRRLAHTVVPSLAEAREVIATLIGDAR
jgi:HAD superfamily hydrolase (TIGR01509 family)